MTAWILVVECVILLAIVYLNVVRVLMKNPESMIADYPPEIQEAYFKSQGKSLEKEKMTAKSLTAKAGALIIYAAVMAIMAYIAGAHTFLQGFLAVVIYGIALFSFDTFILDWIFFPRIRKFRLPGTEYMDREYRQKWFHVKACFPMIPVFAAMAVLVGLIMVWTHTS